MRSKSALAFASIVTVALGACTPSAASPSAPTAIPTAVAATAVASETAGLTAAPTQVAVASLTASAVATATAAPTTTPISQPSPSSGGVQGPKPTPNSIDPCSLLRASEASRAIGKPLSAGVLAELVPNRICTFSNGLTSVKVILAPPAPDRATATAYWDAFRTQVPPGVSVHDLPYFDRSAYGFGSAAGRSLSGLPVIDGSNVFELFCELPACSQAASIAAAQLIAGRLP